MTTRLSRILWCSACPSQITCYGFADTTRPPTGADGPWLCLFCATEAHRLRPGDISQAFTTTPVPAGSVWPFPTTEEAPR